MRCSELTERLESLASPAYACEWDNVGLLAGRFDKEVKKVLVALDATDGVIEEAVERKVDFLLTHHPLIFKPLKKVNDGDFISRRIVRLIQSDIAYFAMHTNFDAAPGCMADLAAERLGLLDCEVLEREGTMKSPDGVELPYGIGRTGNLPCDMSVRELGNLVKQAFGLPFLTVYGDGNMEKKIRRVAIAPGSGKSTISCAIKEGAGVLITGDIGHHDGIDAAARDLIILDAGHYGLEHIFIDFMADYLKGEYGDSLEIHKTAVVFPARMM